jgi:hypothetical protein
LAANGVESYRQKTPLRAAKLAKLLLDWGADVEARASMYGAEQTTYALLLTSAHPTAAGVRDDLMKILKPTETLE